MTTTHGDPATSATTMTHPATRWQATRTADCGCGESAACDPPKALQRNAFFPRKLMEVRHWQAEQRYHRSARELVTRLGLGAGVLCGLEVVQATDTLVLTSGVAVDGHGRLVVVPRDVEVDPTRLTDCCGRPAGDPLEEGVVTVSVCYHECGTDLVALPPEACDGEAVCVPAMVREAYAVAVTEGATDRIVLPEEVCHAVLHGHSHDDPAPQPPTDDATKDHAVDHADEAHDHADDHVPASTDESQDPLDREGRRLLLDELHPRSCSCDEDCVPLAVVRFGGEQGQVVDTEVRTVLRSNRELLDLILCLADRVDECCHDTTVARPPRITALWPWPDSQGAGRGQFVENHRLELAFDRDLAEQGLDDPSTWLGVWLLDKRGATRLPLTRAAGALSQVVVPANGDGAAYSVEVKNEMVRKDTLVVVMARSTAPGPIRANDIDQLALDPDLAATGLSPEQREKLWGLQPSATETSFGSFAADAVTGPAPFVPTGDGTAGGDLHVVLRPGTEVAPPPQLLAVWPPGGVSWDATTEGPEREEFKKFLEHFRIELTLSRQVVDDATHNPSAWVRLWHFSPDGDFLYAMSEIGLVTDDVVDLGDGTVRVVLAFMNPEYWPGPGVHLVQLRSTPPLVTGSPVGKDDPQVLLDADFAGTVLDSQTLFRIWSGDTFPNGLAWGSPTSTTGQQLFDGTEGGLAHWAFTIGNH